MLKLAPRAHLINFQLKRGHLCVSLKCQPQDDTVLSLFQKNKTCNVKCEKKNLPFRINPKL